MRVGRKDSLDEVRGAGGVQMLVEFLSDLAVSALAEVSDRGGDAERDDEGDDDENRAMKRDTDNETTLHFFPVQDVDWRNCGIVLILWGFFMTKLTER